MAEKDRQLYLQRAAQLRDKARTAKFANAALLALAMKYERLAAMWWKMQPVSADQG
jgi:hypothetical protein